MHIFIKTLTGRTATLEVDPEDTIAQVKQKFFEKDAVPVQEQRLLYGGHELKDENCIKDYEIQRDSTLHLVLRLPGGGRP